MKQKSPKKRKYEEEPSCSVGLSKVSPSKVAKVVTTEHSYANKRINVDEKLQTYKKQVKALKQQVRRKNKKIKNMEELLKLLKKEKLQLKTYGKMYTMPIVHQNLPSIRHQLNKTILFRNQ